MSRLRKRLVNYYADEGLEQPLRIVIPAGTYAPEFEPLTVGVPVPAELRPPPPSAWRTHGRAAAIAASVLLVAAMSIIIFRASRPTAKPSAPGRTSLDCDPGTAVGTRHVVRILAGS